MSSFSVISLLFSLFLAPFAHSAEPVLVCETQGAKIQSRFGIFEHSATHLRIEWLGNTHFCTGICPVFSGVVKKNSKIKMDYGKELWGYAPSRVILDLDLQARKGTMKYYGWKGNASSLILSTSSVKASESVRCKSQ